MRLLGWPLTILVMTSVEIGVRIDGVEFAGFDQRCDDRPMLAAAIGAGEERILPIQCDGPDAALDDIGIDLDAAVVEEAGETVPARERIADCLGELGLLADQGELGAQPGFQVINDRPAPVLADGAPLVGAAATDFLLDGIETGDAFERFAGDRRRARGGEFVEAAANMGPAEGELHVAALGEHPIAAIAVDLQNALEAGEVGDRPLGLAIGRIDIGDARWVGAAPRPIITRVGP